jgi:hypothetical protein
MNARCWQVFRFLIVNIKKQKFLSTIPRIWSLPRIPMKLHSVCVLFYCLVVFSTDMLCILERIAACRIIKTKILFHTQCNTCKINASLPLHIQHVYRAVEEYIPSIFRVKQGTSKLHADLLLGFPFWSWRWCDIFFRNVDWVSPDCTMLYSRRYNLL